MAASSSSVSLSNLGGGSYVSNAALATVLKNIKEDPTVLEGGSTRWAVKRKREKDVRVSTFFGALMQSMTLSLVDGSNMAAWFVHPVCLLDHLVQTSAWFAKLMTSTMQQFPGEWSLVWYADEVTPGNALRPLNHRKTWTGQTLCTSFYFLFWVTDSCQARLILCLACTHANLYTEVVCVLDVCRVSPTPSK